jgi:hypothetical protein
LGTGLSMKETVSINPPQPSFSKGGCFKILPLCIATVSQCHCEGAKRLKQSRMFRKRLRLPRSLRSLAMTRADYDTVSKGGSRGIFFDRFELFLRSVWSEAAPVSGRGPGGLSGTGIRRYGLFYPGGAAKAGSSPWPLRFWRACRACSSV